MKNTTRGPNVVRITSDQHRGDFLGFQGREVLREMLARLEDHDIEVLRRTVPERGSHQLFIEDPNGVKIELNFEARELADLDPE